MLRNLKINAFLEGGTRSAAQLSVYLNKVMGDWIGSLGKFEGMTFVP